VRIFFLCDLLLLMHLRLNLQLDYLRPSVYLQLYSFYIPLNGILVPREWRIQLQFLTLFRQKLVIVLNSIKDGVLSLSFYCALFIWVCSKFTNLIVKSRNSEYTLWWFETRSSSQTLVVQTYGLPNRIYSKVDIKYISLEISIKIKDIKQTKKIC